ncbi:MAG: hypothetical protein L6R39_002853 [Caloplaca ligustica]|nr:MAG: hypothetical protein L6R39_002853 [Caloplaca ligustica]
MALVRDDAFDSLGGGQLVKDFCGLVNHKDVWHLAEMVVPEFRMSKAENDRYQAQPSTCLIYVFENITQLPARNDRTLLTTEQDMLRRRYRSMVRVLLTGGNRPRRSLVQR